MRRDRIPSVAELQRMPAGERGPRLRALEAYYRGRLAVAEAGPANTRQKRNVTGYRRVLASIAHVAGAIGSR